MKTDKPERQKLFDQWAGTYDQDLGDAAAFPFIGYDEVLNNLIETAELAPNHTVLDLGIGTGNLAKRFPIPERQIWGVDFSKAMLDKAQTALPNANLIQADLAEDGWLLDVQQSFDRILSAYTFHEFPDKEKIALIKRLADRCLHQAGWIVIADISFADCDQHSWAQQTYVDLWDEDEYYWCAEPLTQMLGRAGFSVQYNQVSPCAGIYRLKKYRPANDNRSQ